MYAKEEVSVYLSLQLPIQEDSVPIQHTLTKKSVRIMGVIGVLTLPLLRVQTMVGKLVKPVVVIG